MKTKLNPSQAWHLQWVAAAYPKGFRELSRSTAMNSLVRNGLAWKSPTDGWRKERGRVGALADFALTFKGYEALEKINPELHARVYELFKMWIPRP